MKVSCLFDVVEPQQDLPDVFGIVNVLVSLSDIICLKDSVNDGFEMAGLNPFNDASQLFVHHGFIGPRAHVDTKHGPVSGHQSKRVKFRRFP